ncbi:MAG TPA: hypothetical protein V6C65_05740 [Allocoleopsis sp.]
MNSEEQRAILVRARARKFAEYVRSSPGLAFSIPDEIIDWLKDDEVQVFFRHLESFRAEVMGGSLYITSFNDDHTHAEVMQMWDRAIKLAEADECSRL